MVAGPRAEPAPVVASATPVPQPLGARPVPTERVRNEPAPPKPAEPAKPQAAARAPAATSETRGALPAALFGIALLLAVVGTILVRARRRMIAFSVPRAQRSTQWCAADPGSRSMWAPDQRRTVPLRFTLRRIRGAPDIAAATLQPAIDPLVPEAPGPKSPGIEPAPDVEQSLRRLLAAWERRAA
jgi:hypothetical protein